MNEMPNVIVKMAVKKRQGHDKITVEKVKQEENYMQVRDNTVLTQDLPKILCYV